MRIRLPALCLTVVLLPLSLGLAQTTAGLDSIPARMHDVIVANAPANRYRADLDCAGLAGGRCGFTVAMPAGAEDLSRVAVRRAGGGEQVAMPQRTLIPT